MLTLISYSPPLRKDRYRAVFRKPMPQKNREHNVQIGKSAIANPLTALNKQKQKERKEIARKKRARAANQIDEGVADMESSHSEQEEDDTGLLEQIGGESTEEEEEEVEQLDETGNAILVKTSSTAPKAKKRRKESEEVTTHHFVDPSECHAFLHQLFDREKEILREVYQMSPDGPAPSPDMFFIQNLIVPPNKYRPESKTGLNEIAEPPEHEVYKRVLSLSSEALQIRRELQGEGDGSRARLRSYEDFKRNWTSLQEAVNGIFDSDQSGIRGLAAKRAPEGIKQRLEKKEGMFRMNIMGKRVNFAARSVISPDPNIETNEIGVPPVFAKVLTYPEPVTSYSFDNLKQAVLNGPKKWPGANAVEYENGQVISLDRKNDDERQGIANLLLAPSSTSVTGARAKKVHRHLANGDMVIMNRQPTLHKPSMMCHRAKILKGEKTIRMHYANCHTYNADFDGDEMNMHFPQNELARAEAMEIADTDHQYLSATAGKPLRGLIQDHISMATWLTCVDMFFTRPEYNELLYSCLRPESNHTEFDKILMVDPAIHKPITRWTGKQVVTTILLNICPESHASLTMEAGCQTDWKLWGSEEDKIVRIVDGEMLTGVLDKKLIGPSAHGLTHSIYEVYGHAIAGRFTGILGRLLTRMLNMRAFSCGIEDLLLTDKGNAIRREKLAGAETVGIDVAAKYVSLTTSKPTSNSPELLKRLENVSREEDKQNNLDLLMNAASGALTTQIWESCLPAGLFKPYPKNQMQLMTTSGAKGSAVNASQISANLGQQVLEGRRVPVMVSGKTLPSFKPFETSIRAGGYITDRFLTGVRPQEYYFQLMAGREGLIDTAVKTSRSGYLQRCLIKGMEGLRADYDSSVRDADGTMIQTMYGEDGLEIIKQQKLMDFKFLSQNFLSFFEINKVRDDVTRMINDEAINYMKASRKVVGFTGDITAMDPALSIYPPLANAGSTSEKFFDAARKYINDNPDGMIRSKTSKGDPEKISKKFFQHMLNLKYSRAIVEPGEAVGVVAGQSIGEPSTQMTLNTFHLAGFAAKNVTLGIPRLREILMTASDKPKKPTMTLFPIAELTAEDCEKFAKSISRLPLSYLIDHTSVEESVGGSFAESRVYKVRLHLYPAAEYTAEYAIKVEDVSKQLEDVFTVLLITAMKKEMKKRKDESSLKDVPEIGKSAGRRKGEEARPEAENEGGDSDAEAGGDDDAADAKRKANLDEGVTYEDADESDEEVEKQGQKEAADAVADSPDEPQEDEGYGSSKPLGSGEENENAEKSSQKKQSTLHVDKAATNQKLKSREDRVKDRYKEITAFKFDENKGDLCEITFEYPIKTPKILVLNLVRAATRETLIHEVEGLDQCIYTPLDSSLKDSAKVIMTEGANLMAARKYGDIINTNKTQTNDIHMMLQTYGVEAARAVIVQELQAVFSGHKIDVSPSHISLISDYQTRAGGFSGFNRQGFSNKTSPFAKMSFETTAAFLAGAIMDGEIDDLSNPSSRITTGSLGKMGSGMSAVMMPVLE